MIKKIAVQLHTLREELKNDFYKTLEDVAKLGYDGVEFAGYFGNKTQDIRKKLDSLGLFCASTHTPFKEITQNTKKVIEDNLNLGAKFVVCPHYDMRSKEDALKAAEGLLSVQPLYKKAGLALCYHNHSFEFEGPKGSTFLDTFIKAANKEIFLQADVFWVEYAGYFAKEFLIDNKDIIVSIHLKDGFKNQENPVLSAVGEGELPIADILKAAEYIGLDTVIVENDDPKPNGLEDIKKSIENLTALLNIK